MENELATLYIKTPDNVQYRIKVFVYVVGIERQQPTHGGNIFYTHDRDADADKVFDGQTWSMSAISDLIIAYERDQTVSDLIPQLDLHPPEWKVTTSEHPLPAEAAAHVPTDVKTWQPGDPATSLLKPGEVAEEGSKLWFIGTFDDPRLRSGRSQNEGPIDPICGLSDGLQAFKVTCDGAQNS